MIVAGAPLWLITGTALLVSLRFVVYSATVASDFSWLPPWRRALLAYLTIDVPLVLYQSCRDRLGLDERLACLAGANGLTWVAWQVASIVGIGLAGLMPGSAGDLAFVATLAVMALVVPLLRSATTGGVRVGRGGHLGAGRRPAAQARALRRRGGGRRGRVRGRPGAAMTGPALHAWLAIGLLTAVCALTRSAFLLLPPSWRPGPSAEPWLRLAPLAALAALVGPDVALPAIARLAGDGLAPGAGWGARLQALMVDARAPAALALLVAGAWRRSAMAGMTAGIACYLALRAIAQTG
jgi:branched-subunit amino acid transport protein